MGSSRIAVFLVKARVKLSIFVLEALLRPERPPGMVRFGTFYGGWWLPEVDPARGPAFCVGAGTDVSFDLELQRLGYQVYTVDPTPAAVDHVQREAPELTLLPIGLWTSEDVLEFAQDETWSESWAIGDNVTVSSGSTQVLRFPVTTVRGLLETAGESGMSVLKMDIEGAEHDVIEQMLGDGVRPYCLGIEFDDHRFRSVLRSHRRLRRAGYVLLHIEELNHIYVLDAERPRATTT